MQNITGVGVGKARKFGAEFVKLIKAYVEEKEIIRPQDMVVKSVASKSGNKIFIIQSIDRKMDFEDIARAKNLDFDELLTEIETSTSISRRMPRAIRSTTRSRSWAATTRRRRSGWCASSSCASRAIDPRRSRGELRRIPDGRAAGRRPLRAVDRIGRGAVRRMRRHSCRRRLRTVRLAHLLGGLFMNSKTFVPKQIFG